MVMTQDTLDKTRSEFSYVFSRSPHHFSLPLLIRIHQACTRQQPFSFLVPPFFFLIPNFSIKEKKIIVVSLFFQKALLRRNILKKKGNITYIVCSRKNVVHRSR